MENELNEIIAKQNEIILRLVKLQKKLDTVSTAVAALSASGT